MEHANIPARMMLGLLGAAVAALAGAQAQPAASPAASLGLFVYPAKGQDAAQQAKDETECYGWSKTQSGFDPAAPAPAAPSAGRAGGEAGCGRRARQGRGARRCRRRRDRRGRE